MDALERSRLIDELEAKIQADQKRLAELRRGADERPVADHELQGWDGPVRLSGLFGGKPDLILVHNMGSRCPYCTLWADGLNGVAAHLQDRAAFVVCSPDVPEKQREFASGRGWRFRMVHDPGSAFTRAMGYVEDRGGRVSHLPGVSTFRRRPEGTIHRVAHAPFGPGDPYCGAWHLFDLLEGGTGGWEPRFRYGS